MCAYYSNVQGFEEGVAVVAVAGVRMQASRDSRVVLVQVKITA
jgi:hypothetical protein